MNKKKSAVALLVLTAITFYGIRDAFGELVFEDDLSPAAQENDVAGSRKNSEAVSQVQGEDSSVAASPLSGSSDVSSPSTPSRPDYSRSESMRRQRMRAELQNEDKLTEKLEELRLKDEMTRVNQLIGNSTPAVSGVQKSEVLPLQEQKVGSIAPAPTPAPVAASTPVVQPVISGGASVAEIQVKKDDLADSFYENRISIMPRGGIASIADSKFDVTSKYALGLSVGVDVSDYFTIEAGYTYAAYNLSAGNAFYYDPYYGVGLQTLNMNQNIIDLGLRVNVLGNKYRVRPFVSGGVGYYRSSVNLDDRTLSYVRQYNPALAGDYVVSGFTGYVGTGVEFRMTKSLSLTGMFKYYNVLSASQSNPISSAAFVNSNGAQGSGYAGATTYGAGDTRMQASQFLSRNNFYSVMAGISLSF